MYCTKCGKKIKDDSSFCIYCGEKVKKINVNKNYKDSMNQNNVSLEDNKENLNRKNQESKKSTKIILICAVCLALGVLGGIAFTTISNKNETSDNGEYTTEVIDDNEKSNEVINNSESQNATINDSEEQETEEETQVIVNNSDYIIPDSSTREISESELYNLTQEQCLYARNEIFARHHRLFNTPSIQAYFNSKSWYDGYIEPENFTNDMLNSIETKNANTILAYEKSKGWQ